MSLLSWISLAPRQPGSGKAEQPPPQNVSQHWAPIIDRDSCIGCERCVSACGHGCLEMIWSFATLTQPTQCTGEGRCTEACPQQIIRMDWVTVQGNPDQTSESSATT